MKNTEIERKFLVLNDGFKKEAFKKERIVQGFLSSVPERTVRVRLIAETGFITVKGSEMNPAPPGLNGKEK